MLIAFNKPYNVLSQFTDEQGHATLADYIDIPDIYAAGRLDADSEGLLLLTNDGKLQQQISDPAHKLRKAYWVQVEGIPDRKALWALRRGVEIQGKITLPAEARLIDEPDIWPRKPPIRERQHIPTSWLKLTIAEGRNRQIRRMTATVGHPTLRLIRAAIGPVTLEGIKPGEYREIDASVIRKSLEEISK